MFKRVVSILLVAMMCISMSAMAFAAETIPYASSETKSASVNNTKITSDVSIEEQIMPLGGGVETWDKTSATVGTFTMEGNNLTPVKTMGRTGHLIISATFETQRYKDVKLLVEIRDASTQKVLASETSPAAYKFEGQVVDLDVKKGQRIQVFFKVFDQYGNYDDSRLLTITYGYRFK